MRIDRALTAATVLLLIVNTPILIAAFIVDGHLIDVIGLATAVAAIVCVTVVRRRIRRGTVKEN